MSFARLHLIQTEPVIFSERAATEGAHKTLPYIPGSALLGWAAAAGRYDRFPDPFVVFHSGHVRFSNAIPLVSGEAAFPVPQLLMKTKNDPGEVSSDWLEADCLHVGRPARQPGQQLPQLENLRDDFVTHSGRLVRPDLGLRLRTATSGGRAATGQLFGYGHINPRPRRMMGKDAGMSCYAATIEADDGAMTAAEWQSLLAAFDRQELQLGRGSSAAYGGAFACSVVSQDATESIWPTLPLSIGGDTLRIWLLSDLATVDRYGQPCFAPGGEAFGIPGATLRKQESAISVRRYAPWNRWLGARDVERQVIQAGSVLSFNLAPSQSTMAPGRAFGLWQEAGLGRVSINPKMLDVAAGNHPVFADRPALPVEPLPRPAAVDGSRAPWSRALSYLTEGGAHV